MSVGVPIVDPTVVPDDELELLLNEMVYKAESYGKLLCAWEDGGHVSNEGLQQSRQDAVEAKEKLLSFLKGRRPASPGVYACTACDGKLGCSVCNDSGIVGTRPA